MFLKCRVLFLGILLTVALVCITLPDSVDARNLRHRHPINYAKRREIIEKIKHRHEQHEKQQHHEATATATATAPISLKTKEKVTKAFHSVSQVWTKTLKTLEHMVHSKEQEASSTIKTISSINTQTTDKEKEQEKIIPQVIQEELALLQSKKNQEMDNKDHDDVTSTATTQNDYMEVKSSKFDTACLFAPFNGLCGWNLIFFFVWVSFALLFAVAYFTEKNQIKNKHYHNSHNIMPIKNNPSTKEIVAPFSGYYTQATGMHHQLRYRSNKL